MLMSWLGRPSFCLVKRRLSARASTWWATAASFAGEALCRTRRDFALIDRWVPPSGTDSHGSRPQLPWQRGHTARWSEPLYLSLTSLKSGVLPSSLHLLIPACWD